MRVDLEPGPVEEVQGRPVPFLREIMVGFEGFQVELALVST